MQYYYCTNCGYVGNFLFHRKKNIKCSCCEYEPLELTEGEYNKEPDYRKTKEYKDDIRDRNFCKHILSDTASDTSNAYNGGSLAKPDSD